MNMKSIEDVFIHLLSDTYSAEKQLTRALAKLSREAASPDLSAAFKAHPVWSSSSAELAGTFSKSLPLSAAVVRNDWRAGRR